MAEDLARWASFSTPTLSDALDRLGIAGQALGIRPLSESFRLVGRAFTLKYEPIDLIHPKTMGDFIDDVPPGAVIVIDNAGR
ncbi:MAG: RraA family protein, partial [Firmicutes bacterium]|nr:RraA family protein [Bacillota bacterium]